ncbi:MAG: CDP-archaeol synthase [bacterium]|nr:CDP-archaeol synthase [bacterium]
MYWVVWFGKLTWFFLPAGLANMAPVLFRNSFKSLAYPINKKLFGNHKTWRGLVVAIISGGLFFVLQRYLGLNMTEFQEISAYNYSEFAWWFGFLFAAGAIFGDLIKSFFKRRFHHKPGTRWFPFDQIDFLLGSGIVLTMFAKITIPSWLMIIIGGIILHLIVNQIGFRLKLKDNPW